MGIEIGKMSQSQYKMKRKKAPSGGSLFPFTHFSEFFIFCSMEEKIEKVSKLLTNLPVKNKNNFSRAVAPENDDSKTKTRTFPIYVDTQEEEDYEPQQIVKEKTNLFLRYVHSQMELKENKRRLESKRKLNQTSDPDSSKLAKLD